MTKETKNELKALLRAKIGEKRIERSSGRTKDRVLNDTMKKMGIDKDMFMECLKKSPDAEISMSKKE